MVKSREKGEFGRQQLWEVPGRVQIELGANKVFAFRRHQQFGFDILDRTGKIHSFSFHRQKRKSSFNFKGMFTKRVSFWNKVRGPCLLCSHGKIKPMRPQRERRYFVIRYWKMKLSHHSPRAWAERDTES